MSPVDEADCFSEKNTRFLIGISQNQQWQFCRILVGADFVAAGGMWILRYDSDNRGGGERWRRESLGVLR